MRNTRVVQEMIDKYSDTPWITTPQIISYTESLLDHIAYVKEAGRKLDLPDSQLEQHDYSKWMPEEFPYYVRQFHGDKGDPDGFASAWLHHIHYGNHHWQHFIFPDGFTPRGSDVEAGLMRMPKAALREMVADWQGASRVYTGSWDIECWLLDNLGKIRLHTASWAALAATLCEVGYDGKGLVYGR